MEGLGTASEAGPGIPGAPASPAASRTILARQATPLRTPPTSRPQLASVTPAAAAAASDAGSPALPPLAVLVLNKMGFGPRPGDVAAFEALGATDDERLTAYVDQQLHPESLPDPDVEARLLAAGLTALAKTREQLWQDHHLGPDGGPVPDTAQRLLPLRHTERATFLKAMHSRRQLNEVLADFWHNHFNVYGADYWAAPMWVHYDRDIIRAHMLGNFRVMLEAVAKSFPMLIYLDNYSNVVSGPNENYARELFELHGLGAENYLGVRRQDEVPVDADRHPVGYVDDDVYESTRAFTGWSIDFNTGGFQYNAPNHDRFQKYVLGRFLRVDQPPMKDGLDVLDLIANHPGTARYIARKLCRRFVADDPPQRLVEEAAAVFRAQKDAADQLSQVVRAILLSPEFRSTWGRKSKRPFELVVSCFRAVEAEISLVMGHTPSDFFLSLYNQAGHPIFQWQTPDGFPDTHEKWTGSNALVGCWRVVNWLNDAKNWWDKSYVPFDPFAAMPPTVRTATAIADFWIQRVLHRPLATAARQDVIEFMARGRDPEMWFANFDDPLVRERVWGLIAILMMSPENFQR